MTINTQRQLENGCVIECIHNDKIVIGYIEACKGSSYHIYTIHRRELKLSASRILPWVSSPYSNMKRTDIDALLEIHQKKRVELFSTIDIEELWECVADELEEASVELLAQFLEQEPTIDYIAGLGRLLLESKDYFRFINPQFEIYTKSVAEQKHVTKKAFFEKQATKEAVKNLIQDLYICVGNQSIYAVPSTIDKEHITELEELLLRRIQYPKDTQTEGFWKDVTEGIQEIGDMLPLQLAQALGILPLHYNVFANRIGYDIEPWEQDFEEEIERLSKNTTYPQFPLCSIPFISIDSETTKDIDDAFYLEKEDTATTVHFAIALPVVMWDFQSPLHEFVRKRATSIYLPESTYNMLPHTLAEDVYSLREKEENAILYCKVTLDVLGNVVSCSVDIARGIIAENCTYSSIEAMLEKGDNTLYPWLEDAYKLAIQLQEKRLADGGICIQREDPTIVLEHTEERAISIIIKEVEEYKKSQLLVSEFMILANKAIAQFAKEHSIPMLYRVQECPMPTGTKRIFERPEEIQNVVKMLVSASLDTIPRKHSALGIQGYSPITSPLRRFVDFINEAQLYYYCTTGNPLYSEDSLASLLPLIQYDTEQGAYLQRARIRYWKLYFLKNMQERWIDGILVDENSHTIYIFIPLVHITVKAKRSLLGEKCIMGEPVQVRFGHIYPLQNEIQVLEIV